MRPQNLPARRQLHQVLRSGPITSTELARHLDVSPRTALRLIGELRQEVVAAGPPIRRRYALRRAIRGDASAQPLYAVDHAGQVTEVATLSLIEPQGSFLELASLGWPVNDDTRDGWWEGLPYPLHDMQPQGFLGRAFAQREHASLEVAADPRQWSDTDIAHVLSRRGADVSGNLLLGEPSLRLMQSEILDPADPIQARNTPGEYARRADEAIAMSTPGSSVGGAFPKFTALRELKAARTPHVIVKFSGRGASPTTTRWSDLLVCEHLAGNVLRQAHATADSRVLQNGGRTYLESERFDRVGQSGRLPLMSLGALSHHLFGLSSTDWRMHAQSMRAHDVIDDDSVAIVRSLWWFGRLIANTDMHLGNLSFTHNGSVLTVAPAYDMLPMAYAPLPGGELPPGQWTPELPLPAERDVWRRMCALAIEFWQVAAGDPRISEEFRAIALNNAERLSGLADKL